MFKKKDVYCYLISKSIFYGLCFYILSQGPIYTSSFKKVVFHGSGFTGLKENKTKKLVFGVIHSVSEMIETTEHIFWSTEI